MTSDRTYPPGIDGFDDLLQKLLSHTDSRVKRERGDEVILTPCPVSGCVGDKFSINCEKAAWNCPKCGERGNAWDLVERLGIGPVAPAFPKSRTTRSAPPTQRKRQDEVDATYEEHGRALESSPNVLAELRRRNVTQETARAWGLCARGDAVGFPYRRTNGSIAFIKFKDVNTGNQFRWPTKAAMPAPTDEPLFHHASFDPTDDAIVVEGEWDALSVWQSGLYNVASISGGCKTWKAEWTKALAPAPRIYLAYDNDAHGEEGVRQPIEALGREVCFRLTFGAHKDANDALRSGWTQAEFTQALERARRVRPDILKPLPELASELAERLKSDEHEGQLDTGFPEFDRTQKGLRLGELTVITAATGMGKTTLTLDLALRLAERDVAVLYVTMEQSADDTVGQLLSMLGRKSVTEMSPEELDRTVSHAPCSFLLAVEPERNRIDQVVQAARYAKLVHSAKLVVVDHLDYLIEPHRGEARHVAAGRAVRALHDLARDNQLHVILICQPTSDSSRSKGSAPRPIQFEDIAETRLATQLPHNGWTWSSDKLKKIGHLYIRKARHMAAQEEVTIEFKFDGYRFAEEALRPGQVQ